MSFDAIAYSLAKKALSRAIQAELLPTLKDLVVDSDKDWQGHVIKNLGEPVDPYDASRKKYVDVAVTGLGIDYYLLDATDSGVPSYKSMTLTPPTLSEAYVEVASSTPGDVEVASWIAPTDGVNVALLGVYTLHAQAEKVGGNIDVRMYFEVYERESGGTENLIVTSYLSDLINGRRDVVVSAILDSNYSLASGSRLVFKVYVRFLSSGSSTTVRFYYQGDVRSRVATPTQKEVLDTLYATKVHALQHELGGADELSLDASQIATGVLSVDRIPSLTRSKITDFFNSPFWDNIPDKPSVFPSAASVFSVDNHIKPPSGATYDLGDHIKDFRIGWFQAVRVGRTGVTTFPPQQGGYIGWNYPSGTGATVFFNNHGGGNTEYIFYSTTDWSSFKELLRITDSYAQFSVDILPNSDNARNIGSSSKRFANLYAVNVYTGDLCFEEKVCDVCGRSFEEGDEIVLKVKKVDDYTRTVPIHVKCSQAYKELDERLRKLEEVM